MGSKRERLGNNRERLADIETKEGDVLDTIQDTRNRIRNSREIPGWVEELTQEALERFEGMPWPTPQEEEWRRTDVTDIDFRRFRPQNQPRQRLAKDTLPNASLDKGSDIGSAIAGQAVYVDSQLIGLNQGKEFKEDGVVLMGLEEALGRYEALLRPILREDLLDSIDNRFQAWHFTLLGPGLFLYIPPFVEISEPFVFEFNESGQGHLSSLRVVVVLDRGARAKVIQKTVGTDDQEVFCNSGMDIRLGESAGLEMYRMQGLNEHSLCVSHDVASVSRDASLRCFDAFFGGKLLKSRFECNLEDRGCEADLQGIYFARHQQHMDIRSIQRHRAPQATSRAFYKGAVRDAARAVYQGLIEVSPLAAKTDAYLTNKNLILNDGARADSIPSLKINTNDVKCSHGSTTGRISDEELFYLMSRGLARSEAEVMLIQAYFEELLQGVPEALGHQLRKTIQSRLEERD